MSKRSAIRNEESFAFFHDRHGDRIFTSDLQDRLLEDALLLVGTVKSSASK
jgi:hypothetical protein